MLLYFGYLIAEKDSTALKKQLSINDVFSRGNRWLIDSKEYDDRINSVVDMIIKTGCPMTIMSAESFRNMVKTLDPKFPLPSAPTLLKTLEQKHEKSIIIIICNVWWEILFICFTSYSVVITWMFFIVIIGC